MEPNQKPYIIGIAGGSASGKTSILHDLLERIEPTEIAVISQDNYYFDAHLQMKDPLGEINFDLPTSIDRDSLLGDVQSLISGKPVIRKEYTFNNPSASARMISVEPAPIIIIEGLFIFHYDELARLMDLKIFVDAREEIKLQRRILRDSLERGYPEQDVRYRWENHVIPSYRKYLRPHRDYCDLIITNNEKYQKGLEVLINHLKVLGN